MLRNRLKSFISFFIIIVSLFVFWGMNQGFFESFKQKETITSVEQLRDKVKTELENGSQEFTTYVKGLSQDDLKNINKDMDGFFGSVDTFYLGRTLYNKSNKVQFMLTVSDNYYVYRNLKYGEPIDDSKTTAKALAKKTKSILNKIIKKDMTAYRKEVAIHDYIVSHAEYGFLKGKAKPYSYKAYGVLVEGMGVCNSYAEAMQLLLMLNDIESQIVVGVGDGVDHAWNLVKLKDDWYQVDATWDDPVPDVKGRILRTYLNVRDKEMAKGHVWKTENYPKANADTYHYYKHEKLYCKDYKSFKQRVLTLIKDKPKEIELFVADYSEAKYKLDFVFQTQKVKNIQWRSYGEAPNTLVVMEFTYY